MASPIEVKILLCDAAVADPSGKVHMLGAGWSVTSSPTAPAAIAVLTKVPWDRANEKIPLVLKLLDADGQPVLLPSPAGQVGVQVEAEIEVGRPPGVSHGSLLDHALVLNLPPLPLPAGRYQWWLDIGDQNYTESFQVRPPATPSPT